MRSGNGQGPGSPRSERIARDFFEAFKRETAMRCEEVREQFPCYAIDQIDEPAKTQVAQHLRVCANCRVEAEELSPLWTIIGSIPAAEPGPELRSGFQMMLEAYKQGLDHAPKRTWWAAVNTRLNGWWPPQPALQLGMCLALLLLGVMAGKQVRTVPAGPDAPPNNEVAELRSELAQMRRMVALSLMQQQSASERLNGVNWSYQLQQPGNDLLTALLNTLVHDASVNVRLATVDALRQFGDQPVVLRGVVEAMSREESPMVQVALI